MTSIGIIGHGIVGTAIEHTFKDQHTLRIYDKFKNEGTLKDVAENSEFIFVAVPTPAVETKTRPGIDLSIMDELMVELTKFTDNTSKVIIIKSTIVPGTTRSYKAKYPHSNFCHSPEFLTESRYLYDALHPARNVVGADDPQLQERVAQLFLQRFPNVPIFKVNTIEAEFGKYMANGLGALKVTWANLLKSGCDRFNVDYEKVKDICIADPRWSPEHLRVTDEGGFGGKCFPKDLRALTGLYHELGLNTELLESIWSENLKFRKIKDWESQIHKSL